MATKRTSNWIRRDKRLAIYLRDGLRCAYCGKTVEDGASLSLDHLLAHHLGGSNHESNLVCCCRSCNSSKQDKTIRQWYAILRTRGIDTNQVGRRIRRLVRKPLHPYRVQAKRILAEREEV